MGCRTYASKYVMNVFPRMLERIDKLTFSNRSNLTTCSIAESNQSNLSNSKTSWNSTITPGGCFRHYLLVRCSKQAIAREGLERGLRPRDTSRVIILSTQHPISILDYPSQLGLAVFGFATHYYRSFLCCKLIVIHTGWLRVK